MKSPWGSRGELCKYFGWTYSYLLWEISWINIQLMIADMPRTKHNSDEESDFKGDDQEKGKVIHRTLETKEDIKNWAKGLM